jgi:radical SAM protein with 4Fe4S-binding SPASM domain
MKLVNKWREVYDNPILKNPWDHNLKGPIYIDLELTNFCSMQCVFCPTGSGESKKPRGYFDVKYLDKLCEEAKELGVTGIRGIRWGEPMLHPKIIDILKTIKRTGLLTHITSNGKHIKQKENITKEILKYTDSMIISFQGLDKISYQEMRGEHWDLVTSNVRLLRQWRDECKENKTFLTLSTTVLNESEDQIQGFKDYWGEIFDSVSVGYTRFEHLEEETRNKIGKETLDKQHNMPTKFKCAEVNAKLSINWDSTISHCCRDTSDRMLVGDLKTQSLKKVWNSVEAQSIRKLLEHERLDLFTQCSGCTMNYDFLGTAKVAEFGE